MTDQTQNIMPQETQSVFTNNSYWRFLASDRSSFRHIAFAQGSDTPEFALCGKQIAALSLWSDKSETPKCPACLHLLTSIDNRRDAPVEDMES